MSEKLIDKFIYMESLPLFVILYAGITHALEADHVLAVSNIVSQRRAVWPALKDGIFWGLGHTSTILIIGLLILVFKAGISDDTFSYFEAAVGLMLILVAIYRLIKFYKNKETAPHSHTHDSAASETRGKSLHKASYGIGFVHGLAGSGALVVLAMTQYKEAGTGMMYLLLYGLGSVVGMSLVSGLFSIPFSKKIINSPILRATLVILSSAICLIYGGYVMYKNLA